MSEFLAPLNYDRARDALCRLGAYVSYTPQSAAQALNVLRKCYPLVFAKTEQKSFEAGAVLLQLPGANVTEPLVFTAHLDVSKALPAENRPDAPAMAAHLSRAHVVALLEALEELLKDGYRPGGDLFLALSMDGLSGGLGAAGMAEHLKAMGIHPCFVLDYGGYATMDAFRTYLPAGAPLALIGIAEKGLLLCDVIAKPGGKQPPLHTLLRCGARLCRRPARAALCGATRQMLKVLGAHAGYFRRVMAEHPKLFLPVFRLKWRGRSVMRQFFLSERAAYALRAPGTPACPAGEAVLSLCQSVIPGEKTSGYEQRIRRMLREPGLRLNVNVSYEHSRLSQTKGEAWDALETAIEIQFERAVIAPCLCPFTTDGRFYASMSEKAYRFSPFMVTGEEALAGLCTVTDGALQTAVQFFRSMLSV